MPDAAAEKTAVGRLFDRAAAYEQIGPSSAVGLRLQLEERDEDLAVARAANRKLMNQLNAAKRR